MPKDKHQAEKANLRDSYVRLFSTNDGKRVIADMKKHFFVTRTPFVPGDPQGSGFNMGLQMAFMHIINRQKKDIVREMQDED